MSSVFDPPLPLGNFSSLYWQDVHGSAASLALIHAAQASKGPLLLICENNEIVERSLRELQYFARAADDIEVMVLPDWETLPYDSFSPHQDILSDRLQALFRLPELNRGILVISITSLMHLLPPRQYIAANSLNLRQGQKLTIDGIRQQMVLAGYQAVESVMEHGEFAVRGSIVDIYPMGSAVPFRLDLFDDELDTIRTFDPETQRSQEPVEEIRLLPGREYPMDEAGIQEFRSRFREQFDVDTRQCPLFQDVSAGINSPGLEYYLALFFEELSSLFDFLPDNTTVCRIGDLKQAGDNFWADILQRFEDRQIDRFRPILKPQQVFVGIDAVLSQLKSFPQIEFRDHDNAQSLATALLPDLSSNARLAQPFSHLQQFLQSNQDARVLFCAETEGRRETLLQLLKQADIHPEPVSHWQAFCEGDQTVGICVAAIDRGFWLPEQRLVLITESLLLGERIAQRRRRKKVQGNSDFIIKNLTELHVDDPVVHIEHGVGRYRGLQTIDADGQPTEFLTLEYANGAKLYVPVASLHLISRYSGGDQETAPLNHLGNDQWQKTRRKAAEKIRDVAAELLDIYARRQARKGYTYKLDSNEYEKFSASFPFEETADQENAIAAVIDDMTGGRPMDRLVCGDVGFGKTEVAMRAAFIAVQNNKQVAMLVPTTLLAQQHFESFKDRFANWPITVEVISRFKSASQQAEILERVKQGKVDILIGTHKLLHAEIDYSNLGLLIIDEEHRFGVRQKEKLKSLRANVDILTLTATPIPRTLNMALSSIRDLSLIVTPPAKRLSVKTFVREEQDSLIKEAVSRELLRGGQVFYLHNEVKSIEQCAKHLQEIVPQARICIAHGQMAERELEKVMADFYHKRYNILVCTTIIETGIDIPSANTIIIERADKFGLAQLHQLRGRVGRSHHQAYAYLLLPADSRLKADAQKRIEAIQAASTLGAGFTLASHDLEIRGAGELLGDEQSGHMQKIGFTLYTEMLEEAVAAIKDGRSPNFDLQTDNAVDLNLRIPALIPEDYLPDVHMRLIMYKRISSASDADEVNELQEEMIDRFGPLPSPLSMLFAQTRLKLRAIDYGIKKIDANVNSGRIEFSQQTAVDPLSLVQLIQDEPQSYKLGSANQLQFRHDCEQPDQKLSFISAVLDKMKLTESRPPETKAFMPDKRHNQLTIPGVRLWTAFVLILIATVPAHGQERWFQIEVSVFSNESLADRAEEMWQPARQQLNYPGDMRRLQSLFDLLFIDSLVPPPVDIDVVIDEPTSELVLPDQSQGQSQEQLQEQIGAVGPPTRTSGDGFRFIDFARDSFLQLPDSESDFRQTNRALERSPDHRLLFHGLWRQPVENTADAIPVFVSGGQQFGEHSELQGSITIRFNDNRDRVVIDADLWLTEFSTLPLETASWELPSVPPGLMLPQLQQDSATNDATWHPIQVYHMQQSRDMRSNEFHYLDHPAIGIVVMVFPYDPPSLLQVEQDF